MDRLSPNHIKNKSLNWSILMLLPELPLQILVEQK